MQCPNCRCHDVYLSNSGNQNVLSFLIATARCHRCCYVFKAPRWNLTERPKDDHSSQHQSRRAA